MLSFLQLFTVNDLRKRFLFTLLIIAVYRLGTHIPISGVDMVALENLFSQGGILGFVDLFSELNVTPMECKIILPTAPVRPMAINMGMKMNSWYDFAATSAQPTTLE